MIITTLINNNYATMVMMMMIILRHSDFRVNQVHSHPTTVRPRILHSLTEHNNYRIVPSKN